LKRAKRVAYVVLLAGLQVGLLKTSADSAPAQIDFLTDQAANMSAENVWEAVSGQARDLPYFSGVQITKDGLELQTTVASPSELMSDVKAAVSELQADQLPVTVPVTYTQVQFSFAQLSATTSSIEDDDDSWAKQGVSISGWGPDFVTNTVTVDLAHYTPEAATALAERYGSIVTVDTKDKSAGPSSSRTADTAPWFGGDKVTQGTKFCTSWFSLHNTANNKDYTAVAGHCGVGTWSNNGTAQGTGTASGLHYDDRGPIDILFYYTPGGTANSVWSDRNPADGTTTDFIRPVTAVAAGYPAVGATSVRTDGTVDLETNITIEKVDQIVRYNGKRISQLVEGHGTGDVDAFTPGDSGGPVYATYVSGSSQVRAYGMIVAHNNSGNDDGWFTTAANNLASYGSGMTIKTS
jgi:hypothetical protein